MRKRSSTISSLFVILAGLSAAAIAGDLTMMVEQDMARLGYSTGSVDGEETNVKNVYTGTIYSLGVACISSAER
jgi:hypothetical protein